MNAQNLELRRNERVERDSSKNTEKTSEGFLRGECVAAIVGVHPYPQPDGSCRFEYTSAEELFSDETIESAKLIPVVIEHPTMRRLPSGAIDPRYNGLVDSTTAKELVVGSTGNNPRHDARHLILPYSVYRADAVKDVEDGKCEISMGYRYMLIEQAGTFEGQKYTHVKHKIRYNHMAIVDAARVGPKARINLDGQGEVEIAVDNASPISESPKEYRMKVTLKINGIPYEVDAEVANAYDALTQSIATDARTAKDALKTAQDSAAEFEQKYKDEKTAHDATKVDLAAAPEKYKKEARVAFDSYAETSKKAAKYLTADDMAACDEGDETGLMKAALKKAKPKKDKEIEAADAAQTKTMFDMLDDPEDEDGTAADSKPLSAEGKQRQTINGGDSKHREQVETDAAPRGRAAFRGRMTGAYKGKK